MHAGATHRLPASGAKKTKSPPTSHSSGEWSWREWAWTEETQDGRPENLGSRDGTDPCGGRRPTLPSPKARGGFIIPYRNLPRVAPSIIHGCRGRGVLRTWCARAPAKWVLDEQRFTPPNIEARPSASGARRRSYTRGSEVGDRCRPSLKPNQEPNQGRSRSSNTTVHTHSQISSPHARCTHHP